MRVFKPWYFQIYLPKGANDLGLSGGDVKCLENLLISDLAVSWLRFHEIA
jgi:hypothetical protein